MFQRIRQIFVKELIQVFRDPRMRMVVFVIPCMEVLIIGYAVTTDVKHVRTAVYDLDHSVESRELTQRFLATEYFDLARNVATYDEARRLVDHGDVTAVLHFDHGFAADLRAGRTAAVQLILDGTDSNTAGIVLGYAGTIAGNYSQQVLVERFQRLFGAAAFPGTVRLQTRAWFNENLESRNYYVPGVIAVVVTLVTLILTSMAIVREKEMGTIEQIMVTPITSWEFILGKTMPFALIAFVDVILVTCVGVFWFGVPVRGNLLVLFATTALYLMTTLGAGLFISTVSQTQQQAMMSTFFFFFPAMLLSGFVFPVENMPMLVQWLTCLNPLRFFLVVIRGVFLKGVGVDVLWPQMTIIFVMGLAVLALAVSRFHKTA